MRAFLISFGVYSRMGTPNWAATSKITPRASATAMPVVMFLEKKSFSMATTSGLVSSKTMRKDS